MDIEEIKKYSKNKIEADNLTKQVRQRIKETAWEKQNQREGFTETFKPLISQFEKPEDSKENIFTQNQKMLRNQLALTSGLKDNQKAITDGFSHFKRLTDAQDRFNQLDRLADMQELPGYVLEEETEQPSIDDTDQSEPKPTGDYYNLNSRFSDEEIKNLQRLAYMDPDSLLFYNNNALKNDFDEVNNNIKSLNGTIRGKSRKLDKTEEEENFIEEKKKERTLLVKYKDTIADIMKAKAKYKKGQGIFFSPQELIKRFELLGGSLAAGNNGVLPEYIQIAHRLRDLGIVTNKQLNTMLRKII